MNKEKHSPTKIFAIAGQDKVTSAMCYYQGRLLLAIINLAPGSINQPG
jgi:hypothetical protein